MKVIELLALNILFAERYMPSSDKPEAFEIYCDSERSIEEADYLRQQREIREAEEKIKKVKII